MTGRRIWLLAGHLFELGVCVACGRTETEILGQGADDWYEARDLERRIEIQRRNSTVQHRLT